MPDDVAPRATSVTENDKALANHVRRGVTNFRNENPAEFQEMVGEFDGRRANLAVLGFGRINVRVGGGDVVIEPGLGPDEMMHGAIYLEAAQAIASGRLTPLQAYFRGDVIVRAPAGDLHNGYGFFVRFSELAFASERLRGQLDELRDEFL
ncbi:hypothetical protein [Streptomyces sp. HUAS TT20]|uniref:hypothetical protein n=1 Tax=Streptomyces sp. HUAS TT20 TaxID=3447509 RepID=UPI0021DA6955|nr:hypothetical protein [Streptomyces sp. HUAS 15-9]UXY32434.1 hypothetical protein N8I87_42135 [Streptomyces sp. HUAS 15-9]